jgi:hypothetical protein
MNCEEIQNRLSEYLDKSLDAISAKSVELHLSSCPLCRAEAAALADCIRQVATLAAVEPPPGFARRVMARARAIETRPTVWQRLFFPLPMKIPLHAGAVIAVAALAILLAQKQPRLPQRDFDPPEPSPVAANRSEKQTSSPPAPSTQDLQPTGTPDRAANKSAQAPRQLVNQAAAARPQGPWSPVVASSSATVRPQKSEIAARIKEPAPRQPPIQAQEVSTGREASRFDQFIVGIPSSRSQPSLRASPFSLEGSLFPLGELSPDVEFVVRRRGTQALVQDLAAKRSAPSLAPQIAEIRWFSVQSELYDQFKKVLAAEAAIESEKATLENDFNQRPSRDLLIKVIILSPPEK